RTRSSGRGCRAERSRPTPCGFSFLCSLQPRKFPAHAGDARAYQGPVANEPEGEADQDWCEVVSHSRHVAFQMAEVAIPRQMFQEILRLIAELRPQPPPALASCIQATDRRGASQMPGKMARSEPRPSVRVTRGTGSGQHLA